MVNVVIKDSDAFFKFGLQLFLRELFSADKKGVIFKNQFTSETIKTADVIVISLCQGESVTCVPELRSRQKGIVIGIVEDVERTIVRYCCFEDIIFISRTFSLPQIRMAIINAQNKTQQTENYRQPTSCYDCQHRTLSPQQFRIMVGLCQGKSTLQIAGELHISERTVFTHKYLMMNKFNLRNDYELVLLIKRIAQNILGQVFI